MLLTRERRHRATPDAFVMPEYRWTQADVDAVNARRGQKATPSEQALEPTTIVSKPSKYRNVKTVGHDKKVYDSAKEARRAGDLALLEKSGAIRGLRSQVDFSCDVSRLTFPFTVHLGVWRADFVYKEKLPSGDWVDVAEDVKGMRTPLYRWKKRHVEAQHNIEIRET